MLLQAFCLPIPRLMLVASDKQSGNIEQHPGETQVLDRVLVVSAGVASILCLDRADKGCKGG